MKRLYPKIHIALMAFAIALATIYFWNGMSIAWSEVNVDLPNATSVEVLTVFPAVHQAERPRRYMCQEYEDDSARSECIRHIVFGDRQMSAYGSGGKEGCGRERANADRIGCEESFRRARSFVWDHWKNKKRGYIVVKLASIESGKEWTRHLFIEPDDRGMWRVVERTIPMVVPDDSLDPGLGDLIRVRWEKATAWEQKYLGIKVGTPYLVLEDMTDSSISL